MKKIFTLFLTLILIIPACFLVGCKEDKNNASNVKNNIYFITNATKKAENITKQYTDANFKIIFYKDTFMAEVYDEFNPNHGYYLGSFKTKEDVVNFEIKETGGYYNNYASSAEKKVSVFSSLRYNKGKLYTEIVLNGSIYSFTLEQKKSK